MNNQNHSKFQNLKTYRTECYSFLMNLLILSLCIIFNVCLIFDHCFSIFKNSITIILKKSKNDDFNEFKTYFEFKSYRFITLLETMKKTMKIILTKKITYLTKIYNLFFCNYIKERECTFIKHAIYLLIKRIIAIWNKSLIMTTLFLNVMKIFDNVSHEQLLHNLRKKRINHRIINWISSFLRKRITIIKINERITKKSTSTSIYFKKFRFLQYFIYSTTRIYWKQKKRTKRKKNSILNKSNYIDDIMLTITRIDSKIHEKCKNRYQELSLTKRSRQFVK